MAAGHWVEVATQPGASAVMRAEVRIYSGEPLICVWRKRRQEDAFEEVWRLEEKDSLVSRMRDYAVCPETLHIVARDLGLDRQFHAQSYLRFLAPADDE